MKKSTVTTWECDTCNAEGKSDTQWMPSYWQRIYVAREESVKAMKEFILCPACAGIVPDNISCTPSEIVKLTGLKALLNKWKSK